MSVYNAAVTVPSPPPVDSMESSPWQLRGGQRSAARALFLFWSVAVAAAAAEGLRISQRLPPRSNETGNQCSILTPDKLAETERAGCSPHCSPPPTLLS